MSRGQSMGYVSTEQIILPVSQGYALLSRRRESTVSCLCSSATLLYYTFSCPVKKNWLYPTPYLVVLVFICEVVVIHVLLPFQKESAVSHVYHVIVVFICDVAILHVLMSRQKESGVYQGTLRDTCVHLRSCHIARSSVHRK